METIRILIADDHEIIHIGISNILKSHKGVQIIGHAYNGVEAVQKAGQLLPDLVFMDISMPEMNGMEATVEILKNNPQIKIIALSQHHENEYVSQILKAGGSGYLLKNSKKTEFFEALEAVSNNKRYLCEELSEQLINATIFNKNPEDQEEKIHLTQREIEIIREISLDKSNQEIAEKLFISVRTVETHRRNLMQKLKVKTVVGLLKYARQHKLIDFSEF